ncbi:NAD(P)H-hydrate dehydratase [Rhodococcus hoagii]|uniref:NAD(P)H-hydrate dehydratase n=1 Tax=Rhodococcus hoagii TaxID=43767 RepID=UPI000A122C31|nr:NAD(P)H-hydrate dehydratase [Prescottella equi]MBM4600197.1 NAD(P)H-hydrate dehydratase [Prescottella equi]ORL81144.1 bifunctional ADP-dependent (S)-NAD(P)H-hydrate dehydratase/NAD(P)H-hydrate epimerase [Prescottella equi]UNQ33964.1 NAD(P)H-hydrate dehydratase [Prescottella equi]WJJ12918.1 NAD(P)H-hydrate dehydratase [Prescottella equi]BCN55267.1 bifunctional NAD(P)H-hydrate repair enzyme [Prescottella equi]
MRNYYTAQQVKAAEAPLLASLPDGTLMGRAAHGLARVAAGELRARTGGVVGRRVTLLVGSGDNGGDALWAGALLRRRGVAVTAVLLNPDRAHPAGLAALQAAGGRVSPDPGDPDLVLDGIVGISGSGPLRPAAAAIVAQLDAPIVAVDLPSGVDPDTGAVDGPAVTAAVTVAFGALKPVHALAAARCGRVELVPIGLTLPEADLQAVDPWEVGRLWPVPHAADDKYTQGVVGVVAGSRRYPGAAVLSAGAAVTATAGMVRYAGRAADEVVGHWPEVVAAPSPAEAGRVQAWVVGPGIGTDDAAFEELRTVLDSDVPVLVDADGLNLLAKHPDLVRHRAAPTLLTPHAGEFERLTSVAPTPDRVAAARALAAEWGVTVLLKGRATVIAEPSGRVLVNDAGSSWAATAGSGDVLSGIVGALLATGLEPSLAAAAGARAHSLAANLGAREGSDETGDAGLAPISASTLLAHLRSAIRILRVFPSSHVSRS